MYRLNIEIIPAKKGGQFVCNKMIWSWHNRVFLFRSDNSYHRVTKIEQGHRLVLSFGIIKH